MYVDRKWGCAQEKKKKGKKVVWKIRAPEWKKEKGFFNMIEWGRDTIQERRKNCSYTIERRWKKDNRTIDRKGEQLYQSWHERGTIERATTSSLWEWGCTLREGTKEKERVRPIFSGEWEESVWVLKGLFLCCCLEKINPRFREEVRLIFLEN